MINRPIGRAFGFALATTIAFSSACPGSAKQPNAKRSSVPAHFPTDQFLYGADVYPEVQSPTEIAKMLDYFQSLGMNTLRVGESAWGELEPREGVFNFGWLRSFLDEMHRRKMKAILGNGSYIAPQWFFVKHPDALAEWVRGRPVNPMTRKAASLYHPAYRAAVIRITRAMGAEFKDHPAVIGWQIDNEIDALVRVAYAGPQSNAAQVLQGTGKIDLSPAAQTAFTKWLGKEYGTPQELNRRWGLTAWGFKIANFSDVKLPSDGMEGPAPVIDFAYRRFMRDHIASFFGEAATALREAGVRHWITSDFMPRSRIASEPEITAQLSVSSINPYPSSTIGANEWSDFARDYDTMRSASADRTFLIMETRANKLGAVEVWDTTVSPAQANLIFKFPIAYGANGSLYWSGNRLASGHWPHWGALLDLNGDPEIDSTTIQNDAAFAAKWGFTLASQPVIAEAAILTDFDQVMAHSIYMHTANNVAEASTNAAFEAFHRMGVGVDAVSARAASQDGGLNRYKILIVSSPTVIEDQPVTAAMTRFAEQGGVIVVMPLTAYQTPDGVFRTDRVEKGLARLTGATIRTERLNAIRSTSGDTVRFGATEYAVGGEGYAEIVEPEPTASTEIVARFKSADPYLEGRAAVTRRKIGRGAVWKLAFWPERSQLAGLLRDLAPLPNTVFRGILPAALHAVPRKDGSMFIMNTSPDTIEVDLVRSRRDRIDGAVLKSGKASVAPHDVVWLE